MCGCNYQQPLKTCNVMSNTSIDQIKILFDDILKHQLAQDTWHWLSASVKDSNATAETFTRIPRKTGKSLVKLSAPDEQSLRELNNATMHDWTVDRLARVWLLMNLEEKDKTKYIRQTETLFAGAEVSELVALYTALPYLSFPEHWMAQCAEGIRSNISDVLQAIMCNNPYPAKWLDERAWNQMVLKAFFTDKPIHLIIGLDERANRELANALSYYAHERWAASRTVNPQLWRCVGKFIDEKLFPDIERIAASENSLEREAAALACNDSSYQPAKELLNQFPGSKQSITAGQLTWGTLAEKISTNKN